MTNKHGAGTVDVTAASGPTTETPTPTNAGTTAATKEVEVTAHSQAAVEAAQTLVANLSEQDRDATQSDPEEDEEKPRKVEFPAYNPDVDAASGRWSKLEDESLKEAVRTIGPRNWRRIAREFLNDTRTDVQCLHRWQKVLRPGLVKGPWTMEEDNIIRDCMKNGITRWSEIAKKVSGRIGKQCRERWFNHLDPSIRRDEWTPEEDQLLIEGQAKYGNRWSKIAKTLLPGRPENAVKNRWNAATRRRRTGDSSAPIVSSVLEDAIARNEASEAVKKENASPSADAKATASPRKRRTGPKKNQAAATRSAVEGLQSLASLCAVALDNTLDAAKNKKKLSKGEKKAIRDAEKALKLVAKKAEREKKKSEKAKEKAAAKPAAKKKRSRAQNSNADFEDDLAVKQAASRGAAALLAAAGELSEFTGPASKRQRGSSFFASRPDLAQPQTISTTVAKTDSDLTTPLWASPSKAGNISPSKTVAQDGSKNAASALQFLSSIAASK